MSKTRRYIVRHDRSRGEFVVRAKSSTRVYKRYPAESYTILRIDKGQK